MTRPLARSQELSPSTPVAALAALAQLWQLTGQPIEALSHVQLTGVEPVLPSSFGVGSAAQTTSPPRRSLPPNCGGCAEGGKRSASTCAMQPLSFAASAISVSTERNRLSLGTRSQGPIAVAMAGWIAAHQFPASSRRDLGVARLRPRQGGGATSAGQRRALEFEEEAVPAGLVVAAMRSFGEWDPPPAGRGRARVTGSRDREDRRGASSNAARCESPARRHPGARPHPDHRGAGLRPHTRRPRS